MKRFIIVFVLLFVSPYFLYAYDEAYLKSVIDEVHSYFNPKTNDKNLETIVLIKILRDGTVIVQKIEKSSGNVLFDRECVRALAKSSPLKPPPDGIELELGVRCFP